MRVCARFWLVPGVLLSFDPRGFSFPRAFRSFVFLFLLSCGPFGDTYFIFVSLCGPIIWLVHRLSRMVQRHHLETYTTNMLDESFPFVLFCVIGRLIQADSHGVFCDQKMFKEMQKCIKNDREGRLTTVAILIHIFVHRITHTRPHTH